MARRHQKRANHRKRNQRVEQRPMKPECSVVMAELPGVQRVAAENDIAIRTSVPVSAKGRGTLHVMFEHHRRRLLDWWPATGTAIVHGQEKRTIPELSGALGLAIDLRDALVRAGAA